MQYQELTTPAHRMRLDLEWKETPVPELLRPLDRQRRRVPSWRDVTGRQSGGKGKEQLIEEETWALTSTLPDFTQHR